MGQRLLTKIVVGNIAANVVVQQLYMMYPVVNSINPFFHHLAVMNWCCSLFATDSL